MSRRLASSACIPNDMAATVVYGLGNKPHKPDVTTAVDEVDFPVNLRTFKAFMNPVSRGSRSVSGE